MELTEHEFEFDILGERERKTKKMKDSKILTWTEIDVHNVTHWPFRSWCRHCNSISGDVVGFLGEHGLMITPCGYMLLGRR